VTKILRTHQISAAVIELIEETKEYCYLVSPYIKMWHLLDRALAKASEQSKRITVITRAGSENNFDVRKLNESYGFEVVVLDFLHTKLYLNEKSAVVSSMNLYDTSSTRNHELALHLRQHEARKLKQEIIDQDLLALQPVHRFAGRHTAAQKAEQEQVLAFKADLEARGYCVACGEKIDFDDSGSVLSPTIIRCKPCWAKRPWIETPFRFRIRHCHYCGESLDSVLSQPYHHGCGEKLREYKKLAS
jgi:hypothetical protein